MKHPHLPLLAAFSAMVWLLWAGGVQGSDDRPQPLSAGFSVQGLRLEKSGFDSVKAAFGPGELQHKGDAGDALTWVCFKLKDGSFAQFGSGEIGGGTILTDIRLGGASLGASFTGCANSAKVDQSPAFDNGIGLGTERKALIEKLGEPKTGKGKKLGFSFEREIDGDFTEMLTIEVKLGADDRCEEIAVSQVTTN